MFKSALKSKLWLLIFLLLTVVTNTVLAGSPSSMNVSDPTYSNGAPAKAGDTVSVSVTFESDSTPSAIVYDLSAISAGGSTLNLNISPLIGNTYTASGQFTVKTGTTNGNFSATVYVNNADGTSTRSITFKINNIPAAPEDPPPAFDGAPVAEIASGDGVYSESSVFMGGDSIRIIIKTTDTDIKSVNLNLSDFGMGNKPAAGSGNTYTYVFTAPANLTDGNKTITITITDNANQTANATISLTCMKTDSIFRNIKIENNTDANPVLPGDNIKFTITAELTNNSYVKYQADITCDIASVTQALSLSAATDLPASQNGTTAVFNYTTPTLQTTPGCTYTNISFNITIKVYRNIPFSGWELAATRTTQGIFNKTLDLGEFSQGDVELTCADLYGNPSLAKIATISSVLTFSTTIDNTSAGGTNNVTVDLSPIGESTPLTLGQVGNTNVYTGNYTLKTTNTPMEGESVSFIVTSRNQNGNTITKTTNSIIIDNVAPTITNFSVLGATGTDNTIKYYDNLLFEVNTTGADSVTIDLSDLDNSGVHVFNGANNFFQLNHIVGLGTVTGNYLFRIVVLDRYGNFASTDSIPTYKVDNNPPKLNSVTWAHLNTPKSPHGSQYVIIGDRIRVTLNISNYFDVSADTIKIDLSSMNFGDVVFDQYTMTGANGVYTADFDIATGPLNAGATFPIILSDNAGNQLVPSTAPSTYVSTDLRVAAECSIPKFDHNPPHPQSFNYTITNRTPRPNQDETNTNIINSWKTVNCTLNFDSSDGDNATTTIILPRELNRPTRDSNSNVVQYLNPGNLYNTLLAPGQTSDYVHMNLTTGVYTVELVATETINPDPGTVVNASFPVIMTDFSGNKALIFSNEIGKIDIRPPVITNVTVTPNHAGTLVIGDSVVFEVTVDNVDEEPRVPQIDLSSLNSNLSWTPMQKSYNANPYRYQYVANISSGTLTAANPASCAIIVYDNVFNFAATYTPEITIENVPPETEGFTVTTGNSSNIINYTDNSLTINAVTLTVRSTDNNLTVTFDLTPIGGSATHPATNMGDVAGDGIYVYSAEVTTNLTNEEFYDYKFVATVRNAYNSTQLESNAFTKIDCVVPEFVIGQCIATITARDPSLPRPASDLYPDVARVGDTISFYASMTNNIGATASVVIPINTQAHITLTRELTYNSTTNRYEASIKVKAPGVSEEDNPGYKWGTINGTLSYDFIAQDDANNRATDILDYTAFNVQNTPSSISSFSLTISPNYESELILNVGSGSLIEYLVASATLDDGRIASNAYLDLSQIDSSLSAVPLASITGSIINSDVPGINLSLYPTNNWYDTPVPITLTVNDSTGYTCATTTSVIRIDTKYPEIEKVAFDGSELTILFTEDIHLFEEGQWSMLGSTTTGLTESIDFSDPANYSSIEAPITYDNQVTITLTREAQSKFVSWASTTIYLQANNSATTAAAKDKAYNWLKPATVPIIITDYTLREEPAISLFTMEHDWNWPTASVTFTVVFTQEMATATSFIASEGVLFVENTAGVSSFNDVNYSDWYVFQAEDKFIWMPEGNTDNKTLKIILCDTGRDWIARHLTSDTYNSLKFAQYSGKRMINSIFNKPLKQYTIDAPVYISDDRISKPLPSLNVLSDNPKPTINLASGTLTIAFKDRALLFTNPFGTKNEIEPALSLPEPTDSKASRKHLNNISLFNLENDSSIVLECKPIVKANNPEYASTTVTIDLTDNDLINILEFYNSYDTQTWGLQINEGCFENVWGENNTRYKPTSPGTVEVIKASPTATATIIACSVSDMPPTKEDTNNFTFDFELSKSEAGVLKLPFLTTASPTAGIFETSTGARIASATLTGWSTRIVKGEERTIATFKTVENFTKQVNGVDAELRIYSLRDVFGNVIPVQVASYVYDVSKRSETAVTGFTTASAAFVIDNVLPTVNSVSPTLVGLTNISQPIFMVEFSEKMDTNVTPTLTIATSSTTITCSFDSWNDDGTIATFKNNRAITASTPNGTWIYQISGAMDLASNQMEATEANVDIKSEVPRVSEETLKIYTRRKNIDNNVIVEGKPFNFDASPDYIEISYQYVDSLTENLPHRANFYNISNELIGSSTVTQNGIYATASLKVEYFTDVPITNTKIHVRIEDRAGNETNTIGSLNYYAKPPEIKLLEITGAASETADTYYYSPLNADGDMHLRAIFKESHTGLSLLLASYTNPLVATMTIGSNLEGLSLTSDFGKTLAEEKYWLAIADEAGNLAIGQPQKYIVADNTPPSVIDVNPGPTDEVANCSIGMATFTIVFNELMDTTTTPFLSIATSSKKIATTFVGWGSDGMTASFTNIEAITSLVPAGRYEYVITGATDMTGNVLTSKLPATCSTIIWPAGPGVSSLTSYALMPDLGGDLFIDRSYNPNKYKSGYGDAAASVTFKVDYVNTPTYSPHELWIYDSNDQNIASLSIVITGRTGIATWSANEMPASDDICSFRMRDKLGNFYPENGYLDQKFIIDMTAPNITEVSIEDNNISCIGSDHIRYFTPTSDVPATFTVSPNGTDELLLIVSGTTIATKTYVITPDSNGSYTISLNDKVQTSWEGNDILLGVSDLAGNISNASITVQIDCTAPEVTLATAIDDTDNPISTVGKEATFRITFDSEMNSDFRPTVILATTSQGIDYVATLTFNSWDSDDKGCEYSTRGVFDTINYPVGTSSIIVSDARDLAGNIVAVPTVDYLVEVISHSPDFYATLISQQTMISDTYLTNSVLSLNAEPNVATLSILYNKGPYALDHTLLVFDNTGQQIATHTVPAPGEDNKANVTVNTAFFGTKDVTNYIGTFTVKLKDSMGNLSPTASTTADILFVLNYDGVTPDITSYNFSGISTASTILTYYYNPDVSGNLTSDVAITASDALRLMVYGISSSPYEIIATRTFDMPLTNELTYSYTGDLKDIYNQVLPEGTYKIQVTDVAGNIPPVLNNTLIVDKTGPEVLNATILYDTYISSGEAGMATFSIQFNESMFDKAYQYLEIATTSYKIPCRFVRMETTVVASDTAIFETAVAVPNTILQGIYVYHVVGTDLTGNISTTDTGSVFVRSAGPVVSSIKTFSYQATTASATLASGNEYHYDDMFSFNVEPKAATMTITLAEEPDGDPTTAFVVFLKQVTEGGTTKETIVASYPVLVVNLMATFTWDATIPPTVTDEASYIIRIADINNDMSGYSYKWTVDNVAPTYSSILFTGGVNIPGSGTVYLNPYRHTNFEITFTGLSDHAPKLRVRNGISTDTYALSVIQSTTNWKTSYRGKYSRETTDATTLMPDGLYNLGLVDQAGNEASSGTADIYQMVIDTKAPIINAYNFTIGGQAVTQSCAPNTERPLTITMTTDEPLTATGAYYLDVYNSGEVRVNRLNLTQNGANLEAKWYGTNESGSVVADGNYTFRVSDLCGNTSANSVTIDAVTAPFQNMGAVQIGSNTIDIWFNHIIDAASLNASTITSAPAISISNITVNDERSIRFNAAGMTHGTTYTLTISSSLKDIYGSIISASSTTAVFTADIKGPELISYNFEKSKNQSEITLVFDQPLEKSSAENPVSYLVTDIQNHIIPISAAILQGDKTNVLLVASGTFEENAQYIVRALGVKDDLGNMSCGRSVDGVVFKGRDITPPVFKISAFSNAANENDIIVVAVSNEELIRVPTLTIKHGSASPISLSMQKSSSNSLAFMAAASLKAINGKTGSLLVNGEDISGNKGIGEGAFTIATVSTKSSMRLASVDKQFSLTFDENSLKSDATVRILQRNIEKDETATGTMRTALQNEYASLRGVRASVTTTEEAATNAELTPITDAYEATLNSKKVNQGVIASLRVPDTASSTTGLGLFYQKNGSWKFISSNLTSDKEIKARITSTQVFAIMRDSVAPTIKLDDSVDLTKAFETSRPEFIGSVKDFGSGIDTNSVEVKIDNNTQMIKVENDGSFRFKPLSELTNGNHELSIKASDRTGNIASTESMRFALTLPFEFKQIIQYPNPARTTATIRIRTNSSEVNCNIKIKIYDVAGHKVAEFNECDVVDKHDGNYEIRWNLTNLKGKKVANGTYIAKLEATNPETGKREKATLKLAVLR